MTEKVEFNDFAALVAEVFKVAHGRIEPATRAVDVDGWDSVTHAMLIMTVEERYGITFPEDEIYTIPDVGALYDRTQELMRG